MVKKGMDFALLWGVFVKETDTDNWLRVTIRKGKLSHISLDNLIQTPRQSVGYNDLSLPLNVGQDNTIKYLKMRLILEILSSSHRPQLNMLVEASPARLSRKKPIFIQRKLPT